MNGKTKSTPVTDFEKVIVVPMGAKAVEIMEHIMLRNTDNGAFECCSSELWDKIEASIDEKSTLCCFVAWMDSFEDTSDDLNARVEYHLAAHIPTAIICLWGYHYCCELVPNVFVPESYKTIKWMKQQPIVSFDFIDIITTFEEQNSQGWDQIVNDIERIIIPNEKNQKKY
jgi:hypothetical protein